MKLEKLKQKGIEYYNKHDYENALKSLRQFDNHAKDYLVSLCLGDIYEEMKDNKKAIKHYEYALNGFPNDYKIYGNLCRIYEMEYGHGFAEKQIYYAEMAYKLNPQEITNIKNLYVTYCNCNMLVEATQMFKLLLNENDPLFPFSYGCLLMRHKMFKDAYRYYHHRFDYTDDILPKGLKNMWQPNIDISDKTILVTYEQGFGDTFMYIRFVKELKCKKLLVLVQKETKSLIKQSYDFDVYSEEDIPNLEYDYFIPMMDLPLVLCLDADNIPYSEGYLKVKDRFDLKSDKFKIGICYSGDKDSYKVGRDVPIEKFFPIFDLDVEIYSFQKGDAEKQLEKIPEKYNVINLADTFNDWEDTASAMKQMDLMITSDCGILNLAGALGIKTFGLFNKFVECRWFQLTDNVAWYKSVKPFQCTEYNGWEEVIQKVIEEIKPLMKSKV